jgi:pimeloyl-ACP methyl ester carboxylesterase
MVSIRWALVLPLILACLLLQACATPVGNLEQLAKEQGFERSTIDAGGFRLLVYRNSRSVNQLSTVSGQTDHSILHIYLEGDGSPWRHRTIIMPDPTPRSPLMLRLMSQDRQPAAYLGRPCYNGTSAEAPCENSLWTSARYSKPVIDSMASAVRVLARRHAASELWLFGHSGGGALAMLLADEIPAVTRVVTIAGNLDTDAWTRHHGYSPLYSSINPAKHSSLRSTVWQWHLLGGNDGVIPPQLVRPFIMSQSQASGFIVDRFDHGCCWQLIWPAVLNALEKDDPQQVPGRQFKFRDNWPDAADNR